MKTQLIFVGLLGLLLGMMTQSGPVETTASENRKSPWEELKEQIEILDTEIGHLTQYRARWTHPGTIEQHMLEHGVDISGKSREQLLAEHDAIHDVVGPVYAGQPVPKVAQVRYQIDNCPGGVCPVPRRPVVNTIQGAAQAGGTVVRAVTPPYRQVSGYGSAGYSMTTSNGYGSGGYSSYSYSSSSYGSGGYSSARFGRGPVRGLLRRVFCR